MNFLPNLTAVGISFRTNIVQIALDFQLSESTIFVSPSTSGLDVFIPYKGQVGDGHCYQQRQILIYQVLPYYFIVIIGFYRDLNETTSEMSRRTNLYITSTSENV